MTDFDVSCATMVSRRMRSVLRAATAGAVVWCATAAASAQAQEAAPTDEIIVTAQKREQSMQKVGISITAIGGDDLKSFGVSSSEQLAQQVPGLTLTANNGSSASIMPSIRGVSQNDYSTHQETPNAVYIDGVYISSPAAISFGIFDIKRVEVLRGPQGTLFGRNATGGLMQFVTNKPTDRFEGYASLTLQDRNGFGARGEAMLNLPISQTLRARVSGFYEKYDGYWNNTAPGGKDAFAVEGNYAIRSQLEWEPSDDFKVGLVYEYGRFKPSVTTVYQNIPAYVDPATGFGIDITPTTDPGDIFHLGGNPNAVNGVCAGCDFFGSPASTPFKSAFNSDGTFMEKERHSATGNITIGLGGATLTSITNYQKFRMNYNEDCDGTIVDFCRGPYNNRYDQWSQELRLDGASGALTWQAGFFYIETNQHPSLGILSKEFSLSVINALHQKMSSWAVFGQAEYEINDQFKVIGGLRLTGEKKSIFSQAWAADQYFPFISVTEHPEYLVYSYTGSRKQTDWSGKIELDYKPNSDLLLYASVSRGTKGGGYNSNGGGLDNATIDPIIEFKGEKLTDYEGGFKSTIFGGMARLNGSVYYYDYKNYQSFELRQALIPIVVNKDAIYYGGELEFSLHPGGGWEFGLGMSLMHTKVKNVALPNGTVVDRESAIAPRYSFNGVIRKSWPLLGGNLTAQVDGNIVDRFYASTFNQAAATVPSRGTANARLAFEGKGGGWTAAIFSKNVTNARNEVNRFDFAGFGMNLRVYDPPRTIGAELSVKF